MGIEIHVYSIGWEQNFEDVCFGEARKREAEGDGCVVVRRHRFVIWEHH